MLGALFLNDHNDEINGPLLGGLYKFETETGVAYLGKSINLRSRIKDHLKYSSKSQISALRGEINRVSFCTMMDADMHIMESYLISKYRPYLNTEAVPLNRTTLTLQEPEWVDIKNWEDWIE